jgi:uncharacterized protein (TIGR03000 family)
MFSRRFFVPVMAGLACLFLSVQPARAQGYLYGYYYPDEHRFHTDQMEMDNLDFYGLIGGALAGRTAPQVSVDPSEFAGSPTALIPAHIRVILPDANARVWFGDHGTTSTGADRLYRSSPLAGGATYQYQVRVTFLRGGQEVSQERTVAVAPGRTTVVDFTQPTAAKTR